MSGVGRVDSRRRRPGRLGLPALGGALFTCAIATASLVWGAPAADAATVDVRAACTASQTVGTVITLTADCATTDNLTIPDGFTLNGAGHTITATDTPAVPLLGPIIGNAGSTMFIENLTVVGDLHAAAPNPAASNAPFFGIRFLSASGSLTNVTVTGITRQQTYNFGQAILVDATAGGPQTVTVTGVHVSDFQKNGLTANGQATMNVTGSTIGPPDLTIPPNFTPPSTGGIAQNSVQYFNSGGTLSANTVVTYTADNSVSSSTGMLLFTANNLTVDHNTITGPNGADTGINVTGGTNVTISYNSLSRSAIAPPQHDNFGFGAAGYSGAAATTTLICNTFAGWKQNLLSLTQAPCIVTEHLPDGTVGGPYSSVIEATTENPNPELTWTIEAGTFPPGLTLNSNGTITGTPTTEGTYTFTARVSDPVDGTATREYTIRIGAAIPTPTPTSTGAPSNAGPGASVNTGGTLASSDSPTSAWILAITAGAAGGLLLTMRWVRRRQRRG